MNNDNENMKGVNNSNMNYSNGQENSNEMGSRTIQESTNLMSKFKCNISFLQSYFDIDTDEILERLKLSLNPLNSDFITIIKSKPDLYGPFWIYTTLVFFISAAGSLTKFLHGIEQEDYFQQFLPLAASVIYGIGIILPFAVTMLMKFFGNEIFFLVVLDVYSYSFSVYIPVMILCVPIESLQWILLLYAVGSSGVFLLANFWKELRNYEPSKKYFILGVIGIFQICLFLVLKLQFFAHLKEKVRVSDQSSY